MAPESFDASSPKRPCPDGVTPAAGMAWLEQWSLTAPSWHQFAGRTVTSAGQLEGTGFSPGAVLVVNWWKLETHGADKRRKTRQVAYKTTYTVIAATESSVTLTHKDVRLTGSRTIVLGGAGDGRPTSNGTISFIDEGGRTHVQVSAHGEADIEAARRKLVQMACLCTPCFPLALCCLPACLPTAEKAQKALQAAVDGISERLQAGMQSTQQQLQGSPFAAGADGGVLQATVVGAVMDRGPEPAAKSSMVDKLKLTGGLKELAELKAQGALTEEEFAAAKAKLLS